MHDALILDQSLPLLRLLTNGFIDEDIARPLLADADMETIFALQTVMIIGMECLEQGISTPVQSPVQLYLAKRAHLPVDYEDRNGETEYLLQPEFKTYLIHGMAVLSLN